MTTSFKPMKYLLTDNKKCFLQNLQPLLISSKLLGISRIEKVLLNKDNCGFQTKTTVLSTVFIIIRWSILILSIFNLHYYYFDIEELIALINNILCSILCFYTDKSVVECITKMTTSKYKSRTGFYFWYRISFISVVHIGFYFHYQTHNLKSVNIAAINRLLCIFYYQLSNVLMIIQFLVFTCELEEYFLYLSQESIQLKDYILTEERIENNRFQYEDLIVITENVNSSVGFRLILPVMFIPVELLLQFYMLFIQNRRKGTSMALGFLLTTYFLGLHCVAEMGSTVKRARDTCVQGINSITTSGKPLRIQVLVKLIKEHMNSRPVKITVFDFLDIDKHLITTILLSVTAYCMVILQVSK